MTKSMKGINTAMPTPLTQNPRLNPAQVADFNREGYLVYGEPVLELSKFAALKNHFDAKLANLPADCRPEAMDVPHFTDARLLTGCLPMGCWTL
jgi:hypothetical protein